MPYIPHTEEDIRNMLDTIGVKTVDELFRSIPKAYVLGDDDLKMAAGLSEAETRIKLTKMAESNKTFEYGKTFMGAGAYYHFIPSAINHLTMRSEFYTAYTPYQPEVSQGTLQSIYEFQTMMCRISGMDVANASMYDAATATAEAVLVAYRHKREKKNRVIVTQGLHPEYLDVLYNYLSPFGIEIAKTAMDDKTGELDINELSSNIEGALALVVQSPNFFGVIESSASKVAELAKNNDVVSICTVVEPTSLGMFKSPGELGFDIAVLEIQALGNPVSFGGPHAGVICARKDFIRFMPGRIVGETRDADGKRAFVLTLSTREQHIRREKATSNICSNQALVALRTAIYLSLIGEEGYRNLSRVNYELSHYTLGLLEKAGVKRKFSANFYNEFLVELASKDARDKVYEGLRSEGFMPGYKVSYKQLLIAVTECQSRDAIKSYVESFGRYLA